MQRPNMPLIGSVRPLASVATTRAVAVRVPAGTRRAIARNVPAGTSAHAAYGVPPRNTWRGAMRMQTPGAIAEASPRGRPRWPLTGPERHQRTHRQPQAARWPNPDPPARSPGPGVTDPDRAEAFHTTPTRPEPGSSRPAAPRPPPGATARRSAAPGQAGQAPWCRRGRPTGYARSGITHSASGTGPRTRKGTHDTQRRAPVPICRESCGMSVTSTVRLRGSEGVTHRAALVYSDRVLAALAGC
jgi:hypothetical protein